MRSRLGWTISYKSLYFVHPSLDLMPGNAGKVYCYFCDIRLKIYRSPNFNMLFQLLITKFLKSKLFSCLQKVDHVIN